MQRQETAPGRELVFVVDSKNLADGNHAKLDKIFTRLCKDFKLSMKHSYNIYSDAEYYYFYDCFVGQPKNRNAVMEHSLKIRIDDV